jgi:hypothetical protein
MTNNYSFWHLSLAIYLSMTATNAVAESSGSLGGYNLGLSYDGSQNHAYIVYDTPSTPTVPKDCVENSQRAGVLRCTAYLGADGTGSGSVGVFLERPFARQGFFYFEPGFTFSTISYKGVLISNPGTGITGSQSKSNQAISQADATQPLTKASLEFYGVNWQGYLRFGITPRYFPDILVSLGGGVQTVAGRVKLFKTAYTRYVIQPEVFGTAEAVVVRYNTGSLSAYISKDQSFVSQLGTTLVDDYPSGSSLSNIRMGLSSAAIGLRLLFPF